MCLPEAAYSKEDWDRGNVVQDYEHHLGGRRFVLRPLLSSVEADIKNEHTQYWLFMAHITRLVTIARWYEHAIST